MSGQAHTAVTASEPTPEVVAQLLDVVADHSVDHALSDMERMIARLRADAEEAAEAREVLRNTPAAVLREALRLRAARDRGAPMSTGTATRYSTRELRAAAAALAAGKFATPATRPSTPETAEDQDPRATLEVTAATEGERDRASRGDGSTASPDATSAVSTGAGPLVRVRAAARWRWGLDDRPRPGRCGRRRGYPHACARCGRSGVVRTAGRHGHRARRR